MRAHRVRAIAAREWREAVGNRSFIVVSLLVPGLMIALSLLPSWIAHRNGLVDVSPQPMAPPQTRYLTSLLLIIFLFLGVTTQSQALLRSVMEERASRMIEVLLSSVRPAELLAGKIIGYATVSATQFLLWVIAGLLLSWYEGLPMLLRVLGASGWRLGVLFVACYIVGYLIYASLYTVLGAIVSAERDANVYQQLFALLLVAPFIVTVSLAVSMANNPNDPALVALTWVPLFTPTVLLLRASAGSLPAAVIVGSLLLSAATAAATLLLAARLFQATTLLSSRRLSWGAMWRSSSGA